MRRLPVVLVFAFVVTLAPSLVGNSASAIDCNAPTSYGACCGITWQEYSPNILTSASKTCWTFGSGTAQTTLSCNNNVGGWEFTGFSQHITRTLTINDAGSNHWEIQLLVEITDPHHSWWNQLDARVTVSHAGSGTSYQLYYHNGSQGDVSCAAPFIDFNAQQGDTITIDLLGSIGWADSYVKVSNLHVFRLVP
jgi:hypothetical protein